MFGLGHEKKYLFGAKVDFSFTGRALTGPLHDGGIVLEPLTVQTATWADWKAAHPETIEPRTFTNVMEYDAQNRCFPTPRKRASIQRTSGNGWKTMKRKLAGAS